MSHSGIITTKKKNLVDIFDEVTVVVDKGRATDVFYQFSVRHLLFAGNQRISTFFILIRASNQLRTP